MGEVLLQFMTNNRPLTDGEESLDSGWTSESFSSCKELPTDKTG